MAEVSDRARTPLLDLVGQEALDLDYAEVARRRTGPPKRGERRYVGAAVAVSILGLLVAIAAGQTSRNADVTEANRAALVERIEARRDSVSGLQDRISVLRTTNSSLVDKLVELARSLTATTERSAEVGFAAGFVAASGPGLRITVTDNPNGSLDGLVRATDLRLLVNALWDVGAEAITINGRRLTALSAIVNADIAIQVNKGPLSPPYVVQAIGGPNMQADLIESESGLTFFALAAQFGFDVERENVGLIEVPAGAPSLQRVSYATRIEPAGSKDQEGTTS